MSPVVFELVVPFVTQGSGLPTWWNFLPNTKYIKYPRCPFIYTFSEQIYLTIFITTTTTKKTYIPYTVLNVLRNHQWTKQTKSQLLLSLFQGERRDWQYSIKKITKSIIGCYRTKKKIRARYACWRMPGNRKAGRHFKNKSKGTSMRSDIWAKTHGWQWSKPCGWGKSIMNRKDSRCQSPESGVCKSPESGVCQVYLKRSRRRYGCWEQRVEMREAV